MLQAFVIIADPPGNALADHVFFIHLFTEKVDHFREGQPGLGVFIGPGQDLSVGEAVFFVPVAFDVRHCHRLDPPGVVDQDLSVYSEFFVKKSFVPLGSCGDLPHCIQLVSVQAAHFAGADLPEIRERLMAPEKKAVGGLVQFRDSDSVFIR